MTITQFGRFRVDLHRRELLADGQSLSLGSRALDLLIVLLEARGKLVTKDELMSRVWPDTRIDWSRSEAPGASPQPSRCPSWVISADFVMSRSVRYGSNFGPTVIGYE